MSIESIFVWLVCGLAVGMCAQFLVPRRQSMSLPMTALLGIVGGLLGGFVYSLTLGTSVEPFSMANNNWYGGIVAILGAMLVLWSYAPASPSQMAAQRGLKR